MNIYEKLETIQIKLKAPKNQKNNFGNYNYRSCEDILEALKPLLKETKTTLIISDEIILIGNRYYVKATANLFDAENENQKICNSAYARECENKKGMDESQVTGACSSYARKYALNGLFAIDDTNDMDALNDGNKFNKSKVEKTNIYTNTMQNTKKLVTEHIVDLFNKWVETNKIDKAIVEQILSKYGFKSINEVDIDNYKKIVNELNNILKKEEIA